MKGTDITKLAIIAFFLAIIVFDVWVGVTYNESATISMVMLDWSKIEPRVVFALGFLLGHLFVDTSGVQAIDDWRRMLYFRCKKSPELMGLIYFLLVLIPWPARVPVLALISGVLAGYFCWPQSADLGR